jgi:hypothetical protein
MVTCGLQARAAFELFGTLPAAVRVVRQAKSITLI